MDVGLPLLGSLNQLLAHHGFDPRQVLVFRHRPTEPELNKALPWLAAYRPEVFNAYQQTQGARVERILSAGDVKYVASFIRHSAGRALFVGLYAIDSSRPLTMQDFWRIPAHEELREYGLPGFTAEERREAVIWFWCASGLQCSEYGR